MRVGFWDHWGISFPTVPPELGVRYNLGHGCSLQFPCVLLGRGLLWFSEWILPAKQDWDNYIKMLQGQKITGQHVITVISPFLVNISLAWYLLLLDFGMKGEVAGVYLQPHPPLLQETVRGLFTYYLITWLLWKLVAQSGKVRDKGRSSLSM